jgi:hypothetical protein
MRDWALPQKGFSALGNALQQSAQRASDARFARA